MVENGYLLDWPGGSLYLEPHGVLDPELLSRSVDTVITPVVDLGLPLVGSFITGATVMPELIKRFHPKTVLASTTGGDVRFSGLISLLLAGDGAAQASPEPAHDCAVVTPTVGNRSIALRTALERHPKWGTGAGLLISWSQSFLTSSHRAAAFTFVALAAAINERAKARWCDYCSNP